MHLSYSFIIPVYNRPHEIQELLDSISALHYNKPFEVVIVEDGSTVSSEAIVKAYSKTLNISYYYKENTGPGDSRNFGMAKAQGNYFLILDSDVILPPNYLEEVDKGLGALYTDCFGGPDAAHKSFTNVQKAINYGMTSFLTTGGIRGRETATTKFEPRSFNMGLSRKAFLATTGFGNIHPGEDPDLSIRLQQKGFETQLLRSAKVFHKRRINWRQFYIQVNKFGKVRPILSSWHPQTAKITYWFPTLFCVGLVFAIIAAFASLPYLFWCYLAYVITVCLHAAVLNKSFYIGLLAVQAVGIQFYGYGVGFAVSTFYIRLLKRSPQKQFPNLFFKK